MLVSIGYENRTPDELIRALLDAGVTAVVDVRQNASSRKPGMSKKSLAAMCVANGITYCHEPTLGNPRENRDGFHARRPESIAAYHERLTSVGADALDRVEATMKDQTVGLLCLEADPTACHRSVVAAQLLERDSSVTVQLL